MKNKIVKFSLVFVVLLLAACSSQNDDNYDAEEIETQAVEPAAAPEPIPEPTPSPLPITWQEAYAALLLEYLEKPSPTYWYEYDIVQRYFILYDIDKDGVPELLIFFLAAGFNSESIYTYRDGEVSSIEGGFLIYYASAYPQPNGDLGIILANTMRHPGVADTVSYTLMVIDGNRLVTDTVLVQAWEDWHQWWDGHEIPRESGWHINDRKVTEEEFNAVYDSVFRGWDENSDLFPFVISEENIQEVVFGWTESPVMANDPPVQQISPFGKQVAIEFLSGFQSIFQSTKGLHDTNTGGFYAWIDWEWVDIDDLPEADIPLVFQSGVRGGVPDNWYSDTYGAFFGNNFYDRQGNMLIDVPFIRESHLPDWGTLADSFILFDFDGNGIPDIVVKFVERGTQIWDDGRHEQGQGWGFSYHGPFVLYRFIDGTYREVATLPSQSVGHYYATFPSFYINDLGEKIVYVSDGHVCCQAYHFTFIDGGAELEPIFFECIYGSDVWYWWNENHIYFAQIHPLTELQNEISELLTVVWVSTSDSTNPRAQHMTGDTIAIWTDTPLRDFRFIEVLIGEAAQDEDGAIFLYAGETLLSADELLPRRPFVVNVTLGGGIPTRAMSFLDENDVRLYFLITYSGYDGSVILSPYPLDERLLF